MVNILFYRNKCRERRWVFGKGVDAFQALQIDTKPIKLKNSITFNIQKGG